MEDQDIQKLTDRVTDLENESLNTDPAIHPITFQNLKKAVQIIGNGVTSATSGTGISVVPTKGSIVIYNTGVTSLTAGTGISLSPTTGTGTVMITGTLVKAIVGSDNDTITSHSQTDTHTVTHGLGRPPAIITVTGTLQPNGV